MRTALICMALAALPRAQEPNDAGAAWLDTHAAPAAEFVCGLFREHDVVLIGEQHLVRENAEFVARLIPRLDAIGVRILGTEFVRSAQTAAVQALVDAESFDESAAVAIAREFPNPLWGHREYLDILRAVHAVNRTKGPGEERFTVLGMDSDWSQAERFRNRDRMASMRSNLAREKNMVDTIRDGVLEPGRKAIVHVGWAHSITIHGVRLGTVLTREYGDRIAQVSLHHELTPEFAARVEQLCAARGDATDRGEGVGFPLAGSPFDIALPDTGLFRYVPDATLAELCQNWVFLAPRDALRRTTWIPGFIDAAHLADASFVAGRMRYVEARAYESAAELDVALAEYFDGAHHASGGGRRR